MLVLLYTLQSLEIVNENYYFIIKERKTMQLLFMNRTYVELIWITLVIIGGITSKPFRQFILQRITWNISVIAVSYILGLLLIYKGITKVNCLKEILWQPLFMIVMLNLPGEKEENIKAGNAIKIFVLAAFMLAPTVLPVVYELIVCNIVAGIILFDLLVGRESKYCLPKWITVIDMIFMICVIFKEIVNNSYRYNILILFLYFISYVGVEYMIALIEEYRDIFADINALLPERRMLHDLKVIRRSFLSLKSLKEFKKRSEGNIIPNMQEEQFDELLWQTGQEISTRVSKRPKQENDIKNEIKEAKFRKRIEYLCDHVGVVTLITTVGLGVGTTFIKILIYAYQCGKNDYFGVNHTNINIAGGNFLYDLTLFLAIIILYSMACYLPYGIVKYVSKIIWKILFIVGEIAVFTLIFLLKIAANENVGLMELGYMDVVVAFMVTIVIMLPGVLTIFYICHDMSKPVEGKIYFYKLLQPKIFMIFLGAIAIYLGAFYMLGRREAENQKEFKVIDSTKQIVLFENEEVYIVADYEENTNITIHCDKQAVLDKKGIGTSKKSFDEVVVQ